MTGVIDVGGGLRGIYGAGVFDYCMDHDIHFDYCCGVSAGSANLVSYMAGQKGRNYKFYTEYALRKEYMGVEEFIRKGSYINLEYVYGILSNSDGEYPLDFEAMKRSGKILRVVATDAETGHPVYFGMEDMAQDDYGPVKASSCVPIVNKAFEFKGRKYYDGGITDPIPIRRAFREGCTRVVVVLTRPRDFTRDSGKDRWLARMLLNSWPNTARALYRRSAYYNRALELCKIYEKEGKVLIVAPKDIGGMKTLTRDLDAIKMMYQEGYEDAGKIQKFISV